jgi:hypothetical protein
MFYSERTVEKLRDYFGKIGVPINTKWVEVEK